MLRPSSQPSFGASRAEHALVLFDRRGRPDKSDRLNWSFWLSARGKRPGGDTSDHANKLASPHLATDKAMGPAWIIAGSSVPVTAATTDFLSDNRPPLWVIR